MEIEKRPVGRQVGFRLTEEQKRDALDRNRVHSLNTSFFECVDTPEKAYLLGFVTADGHVHPDGLILTLSSVDISHLSLISAILGSDVQPKRRMMVREGAETTEGASCCFYSKKLVADLRKLGLESNKTWTVVPWVGPTHLMPHYWRGCVDGDGWVSIRKDPRKISIGFCGNLAMVTGFRDFIQKTCHQNATIYPIGKIFAVSYSGIRPPRKIVDLLYPIGHVVSLERKRTAADQIRQELPERRSWHDLTNEMIDSAYSKTGSWKAAAEFLGLGVEDLYQIRKRRGMLMTVRVNGHWPNDDRSKQNR